LQKLFVGRQRSGLCCKLAERMSAQAKLNDPCPRPQVGSVKWWVRLQKINGADFKLKSFMTELIVAHLADGSLSMGDYPVALEKVFT
jgi:hypothetical protein